jgi:amino acid transporter
MARGNKFGTFGGVFTPSVLTILGVIMYLRLPWIVGQAGLIQTIGIIVVAHVISVTTGLSVSSIATNKTVHAGGPYYIVSRSLGLPLGGTLGLALFVGIAFSISLYVIGFSESFLAYWDIPRNHDTIRLCGSVTLVVLTFITLVSTSLAIKTQYVILLAIIASLVAIFFAPGEPAPGGLHLDPLPGAPPMEVFFGIFFPAVTGFTAGVNLSGDLKDPKRSLPRGTMAAIVVGLFAYIGLATFLAWRIEPEALVNNPTGLARYGVAPVVCHRWRLGRDLVLRPREPPGGPSYPSGSVARQDHTQALRSGPRQDQRATDRDGARLHHR